MLVMMTTQAAFSSCQNSPTNNLQPKVTIIWLLPVPEQDWLKERTSYLSFLLRMLFSQSNVMFRLKAVTEFKFWFWQMVKFLCASDSYPIKMINNITYYVGWFWGLNELVMCTTFRAMSAKGNTMGVCSYYHAYHHHHHRHYLCIIGSFTSWIWFKCFLPKGLQWPSYLKKSPSYFLSSIYHFFTFSFFTLHRTGF